jgi:NAD(P)-dependent dehydrogenase (short-subunit alcohol dehydrogenase family)
VRPAQLIGGNAYTSSQAALGSHTLNLAAELAGTGLTLNAFRPDIVDTAIQAWITSQPPELIRVGVHDRFIGFREQGVLITPGRSAGCRTLAIGWRPRGRRSASSSSSGSSTAGLSTRDQRFVISRKKPS